MNIYFYYDLWLNPPVGKVRRILCSDWLLCTWAGKISFMSKDVFERRTSIGSGIFFIPEWYFCPNFWTNRPYKKRDQERHIWYCQVILKWKRCHFRLTFVAQKRLCFISLMTKLVRSRWLVIGLVLFCFYIVLDLTVHKSEKKNLVSIQPYWPQAWSINLHTSLPHGVTRCVNSPNRCHFVSLFTPPPPSTRPI